MFGKPGKNGSLLNWFRPVGIEPEKAQETRIRERRASGIASSTKRLLDNDSDSHESHHSRSKSPKISHDKPSPLPYGLDSPKAKRVGIPLPPRPQQQRQQLSPESSIRTPTDSDTEDAIVISTSTKSERASSPPKSSASAVNQSFASTASSTHRVEKHGQVFITGSDEDSDELLDIDDLLGRQSIPLSSAPVQQYGRQQRRSLDNKSKQKYTDTSREDEAQFEKLMFKTHRELSRSEARQQALDLARELESEHIGAVIQESSICDKEITAQQIKSRVANLEPEKAEKFAQAVERTELVQPVYYWSFFDESQTGKQVNTQVSIRKESRQASLDRVQKQDEFKFDCSGCGIFEMSSEDAVDWVACDECDIWQHMECLGISHQEVESDSFSFLCSDCQKKRSTSKVSRNRSSPGPIWPTLPKDSAWSIYQESSLRNLAIVGGVFEQAASVQQLPKELYLWVLAHSSSEQSEDLRYAYQSILRCCDKYISSNQALACLELYLKQLGASKSAMESGRPIEKKPLNNSQIPSLAAPRDDLRTWLQNAAILAKVLTNKDQTTLLEILLVLTLDSSIFSDCSIYIALQQALSSCIEYLGLEESGQMHTNEALENIYARAGDVYFRLQCIRTFPTGTNRLCQLKRRLALATFYENQSLIGKDPAPTFLVDIKDTLNKDKRFQAGNKADFRALTALYTCLDIAIGNGNRPISTSPAGIKTFNTQVDELIEVLQVKHARIQDMGAAHMSRTEVKETLGMMEKRLMYAVRTEPKRKRNMFDQSTLDQLVQRG